ncbi:unnamed protein product, partial [Brenthis ino]
MLINLQGVVVMSWWWAVALLALQAPARASPRAGSGLIIIYCLGGVVASMYGCTLGGPGFESRVGPRLVIESFCIVSLSNNPELKLAVFHPRASEST